MEEPNFVSPPSVFSQENVNLRHYWHVLLERRWLVLAAFFSVLILSMIYLFKAPKIFQAVALLQIDREESTDITSKDVRFFDGRDQDYLQTQYKNLKSRILLETVGNQLDLKGKVKDEKGKETDRYLYPQYAETPDLARKLAKQITVAPVRLSRLVEIKVDTPVPPELSANIANTLVTNFINNNLDIRTRKSRSSLAWLETEAATLRKKVRQADEALQNFKEKTKMVSLEGSNNIVAQALFQAQQDYGRAKSEATSRQKLADEVKRLRDLGTNLVDIAQIANDVSIKDLLARLAERDATVQGLLKRYKSKWPDVMKLQTEILSLKDSIEKRAESIYLGIQNEAQFASANERSLKEEVQRRQDEYLALTKQRIEYDDLAREAEASQFLYTMTLRIGKETAMVAENKVNNMRVVDPAKVPVEPSSPNTILVLLMGVFGGLAVAIGLAFFVNYLDDSIKTQDDVETYLRLPFLGYVPNIKTNSLVERDLQSHLHPRSNAAEGFRTIRAAISLMPKADRFRIISVTSTIPSEGKSLTATNLSIVNAQTGLKTLLVDADLRRPSVHKSFSLHSPVGLSAYLMDEVHSVDEIVHSTEVPNLDVVCCGAIPQSPSELIGSKRMQQFLLEARTRYDRLILDCPPVSAVSDPLVLASRADGVLFVTKFNKIRREHARRTIQRLQDAGIHIVGVVLNDIDFEGKDSYYYSYYYYQNRYYASHYRSESKDGAKTDKATKS